MPTPVKVGIFNLYCACIYALVFWVTNFFNNTNKFIGKLVSKF
jgi:hypothetical protein